MYVFGNRRRNRVKILGWERNGFWLLLKRLEQDRLIWPSADAVPALTVEQLHWLLEGIDISVVGKPGLRGEINARQLNPDMPPIEQAAHGIECRVSGALRLDIIPVCTTNPLTTRCQVVPS